MLNVCRRSRKTRACTREHMQDCPVDGWAYIKYLNIYLFRIQRYFPLLAFNFVLLLERLGIKPNTCRISDKHVLSIIVLTVISEVFGILGSYVACCYDTTRAARHNQCEQQRPHRHCVDVSL